MSQGVGVPTWERVHEDHGLPSMVILPCVQDEALPAEVCQRRDDDVRFPPSLVRYVVQALTEPGDLVLDPFAGFGTTLHVAQRLGRRVAGIEADAHKAEWIRTKLVDEGCDAVSPGATEAEAPPVVISGDASRVKLDAVDGASVSLLFTSPPYMTATHCLDNPLSREPVLANYERYLETLARIVKRMKPLLKPGAWIALEASNLRSKPGQGVTTLAWDIARVLARTARFVGETVVAWMPPASSESGGSCMGGGVYGYGYHHSYVLLFRNEDAPLRYRVVGNLRSKESFFVHRAAKRLGLMETSSDDDDAILTWIMRQTKKDFRRMNVHQRVNYVPGTQHLCRKDLLHKRVRTMLAKHGGEHFGWWPEGYLLPQEWDKLAAAFAADAAAGRSPMFIVKVPRSSNGRGVRVITSLQQVDRHSKEVRLGRPLVQRYLADSMLVRGYKFTLRLYVSVTGVDPLRAYVYREGLVRICSRKYSLDAASLAEDSYAHVDSWDLNHSNEAQFLEDPDTADLPNDGLRLSVSYILGYIEREYGFAPDHMWAEMERVIRATLAAGEGPMEHFVRQWVRYRCNAFDMMGFDVFLDTSGRAHILEVNHSPSLSPHTELENRIKEQLLLDYLTLVDVSNVHADALRAEVRRKWNHLQRRQKEVESVQGQGDDTDDSAGPMQAGVLMCNGIDVSKFRFQDVFVLVHGEHQMTRLGAWKRVWPSVDGASLQHLLSPNRNRTAQRVAELVWHTDALLDL